MGRDERAALCYIGATYFGICPIHGFHFSRSLINNNASVRGPELSFVTINRTIKKVAKSKKGSLLDEIPSIHLALCSVEI